MRCNYEAWSCSLQPPKKKAKAKGKGGSKKKGKAQGKKSKKAAKEPPIKPDPLSYDAMLNAYYIAHGPVEFLALRGYSWEGGSGAKKKKGGKRKKRWHQSTGKACPTPTPRVLFRTCLMASSQSIQQHWCQHIFYNSVSNLQNFEGRRLSLLLIYYIIYCNFQECK